MGYSNENTVDYSGLSLRCKDLKVNDGATALSTTELGYLDSITPGTVSASKAVVVDANSDIASFRHVTLTGNIVQGATTISEADIALVDGLTAGTVTASKAVTVDANRDVAILRNVTLDGVLTINAGGTLSADSGTATATGGAATLSKMAGIVTSEALATAAAGTYTLTLTNTLVTANSNILVTTGLGTATTGVPVVLSVTPGAGSASIVIKNNDPAAAFNGTILIQFLIVKA